MECSPKRVYSHFAVGRCNARRHTFYRINAKAYFNALCHASVMSYNILILCNLRLILCLRYTQNTIRLEFERAVVILSCLSVRKRTQQNLLLSILLRIRSTTRRRLSKEERNLVSVFVSYSRILSWIVLVDVGSFGWSGSFNHRVI